MGIRMLILLQLFIASSLFSGAQNGKIKGVVTDAKTNERLVGAAVMLEGTSIGSITDFDGNYLIGNIVPGTYTIRCSFISYETRYIKDIRINPGQELEFNFDLGESTFEVGGVDVIAKVNRQSESMLLVEQKNSVLATQAIGAQEISRKGVSDAEAAVTKVSGISKQEGVKNVFVRGLGDRFNSTSLNGFPVPSEDPEYKNISLDFFASDMLQSVGINKVFGSAITGDVGGAEINIRPKELTEEVEFGLDASWGANTQTANSDFLKLDGVNHFGYSVQKRGPMNLTSYNFKNSLDPAKQDFQLNQSYSASGGKKFVVGDENPLNFFVLGMYSTNYNYISGVVRNTTTTGTVFQNQGFDKYSQHTSHMVMGNLDYRFKKHKVSYNGMYIHTNVQSVGDYLGANSVYEDTEDFQGFLRRQQINDNSLIINQFLSKWKLSDRLSLDAGTSLNLVYGNEPDRRTNYLSSLGNGMLRPIKGTGRQQRYFSELDETDLNVKIGASYKLSEEGDDNKSVINFGYNGRFVKRNFQAVEYDQQVLNQSEFNIGEIRLTDFFNQKNLSAGDFVLDRNVDEYSVDKLVNSGYCEVIYQLNDKITGVGGIRLEKVNMNVDYNVNRGGTHGKTEIDDVYFLPDFNLKYDATEKSSARFGASRTYTLPQAKEISPFRYVDVSFKSQGNPDLVPSTNYNFDLNWDYYPGFDELFSFAVFYKYIQDPISRVEKASAGGFLTYDNIANQATVAGIEMEIRKNLLKTTSGNGNINKLSIGVNSSYILTSVKLQDANFTNDKSQLEGAAPVIVNGDISYYMTSGDFIMTHSFVLNYFSDRVYTIGTQGYQDIIENGIPTLDFVSSAKINKHWGLSLKAKNLLNSRLQLSREPNDTNSNPIILSDYKKGLFISIGISYNL